MLGKEGVGVVSRRVVRISGSFDRDEHSLYLNND